MRWAALALVSAWGCGGAAAELPGGSEVREGEVVDGDVLEGDAVLRSAEDVRVVSRYSRITGRLVVPDLEALGPVALPRLSRVGAVEIGGAAGALALPALEAVGLSVVVGGTERGVELAWPRLEVIGGHLELSRGVYRVALPALVEVGGDLRVRDATVERVEVGALRRIGGTLSLHRFSGVAGEVQRLSFGSLGEVAGDLRVRDAAPLALELPVLLAVGGELELAGAEVAFAAPQLVGIGGSLRLERVAVAALELSALLEVGAVISVVDARFSGALELPALQRIARRFEARSVDLAALSLPKLAEVGGDLEVIRGGRLAEIALGGLVRAGGSVRVRENGPLRVALPVLEVVAGDLELRGNGALWLEAPRLAEVVGSLEVRATIVHGLELEALERVGRHLVFAELGASIGELVWARLVEVGGDLVVARTRFVRRLALPALAEVGGVYGDAPLGSLLVSENEHLEALEARALERVVVDVRVRENAALDAAALVERLAEVDVGGEVDVCSNLVPDTPCR